MMKKMIKIVAISIIALLIISTNVKALTIDPTARAMIVFDNTMPYHYEAEKKVNYKMLTYKGGKVLYTFNRNNDVVMTLFTDADNYYNDVCERIIENGYPVKTYEELGVNNTNEAYFATQEAIYAYLEKKDMSKYIAEDEQGTRILNATKKILQIAKKEEASFKEIDSEWKVYELNENYMYKTYNIFLDDIIESASIELADSLDVKILNEENEISNTVKNGDNVKIIVPKGMNQNFKVKLIYEKQGAALYECYNSVDTSIKYLISEIDEIQKEKKFEVEFKNVVPVTITNYDNITKEAIKGNIFKVLDNSQNIIKENLVTDEEGKIQIFLENGEYFLKQTQVQEGYCIAQGMLSFKVDNTESIELNIYNSSEIKDEITKENIQVNVTSEDKKIVENNVTNVTNIHNTNIEKEIINKTNETNVENINTFVNTTYLKNVNNIIKENTYSNKTWKENVTNKKLQGKNDITNMTRDEYITYIDFIKLGSLEIPNLPVALKQ